MKLKTGKNAATFWQLLTPCYACLSHDVLSIYQVRFFPGNPSLRNPHARQALTVPWLNL